MTDSQNCMFQCLFHQRLWLVQFLLISKAKVLFLFGRNKWIIYNVIKIIIIIRYLLIIFNVFLYLSFQFIFLVFRILILADFLKYIKDNIDNIFIIWLFSLNRLSQGFDKTHKSRGRGLVIKANYFDGLDRVFWNWNLNKVILHIRELGEQNWPRRETYMFY